MGRVMLHRTHDTYTLGTYPFHRRRPGPPRPGRSRGVRSSGIFFALSIIDTNDVTANDNERGSCSGYIRGRGSAEGRGGARHLQIEEKPRTRGG